MHLELLLRSVFWNRLDPLLLAIRYLIFCCQIYRREEYAQTIIPDVATSKKTKNNRNIGLIYIGAVHYTSYIRKLQTK
jgi:hypothetical protein